MSANRKSNSNFLVQGSILAVASILSRIIGLLYRVPLTAIIGNVGNDYYSCAYEIYSMMLLISSAGSLKNGVFPYGPRAEEERS